MQSKQCFLLVLQVREGRNRLGWSLSDVARSWAPLLGQRLPGHDPQHRRTKQKTGRAAPKRLFARHRQLWLWHNPRNMLCIHKCHLLVKFIELFLVTGARHACNRLIFLVAFRHALLAPNTRCTSLQTHQRDPPTLAVAIRMLCQSVLKEGGCQHSVHGQERCLWHTYRKKTWPVVWEVFV